MACSRVKRVLTIIAAVLLVAGGVMCLGNAVEVKAGSDDVYKNLEIFTEVLRQIEENYVEEENAQDLIYGAIKGMVHNLDPHSSFMTKDEHRELMMETKGSFTGIGIEMTVREGVLTVVSPIEDTPAFKVGIKAGDRIVGIEGAPTKDMTMIEAVKRIRGPKGTKVNLTVARKGEKLLKFSIIRDVIPLLSVRHHLVPPDIGYVRISNFQSSTTADLETSLEEMERDRTLNGLLIDLRNNPGGLLSQAIDVADLFLDSGVIVSTKGRRNSQNIKATARKSRTVRTYPIIVLVNGGSASASEIVAGALQDNKRAIILGTRTFGKGSVQTILPLSDGAGLRLTTARYYTPSGRSIQSSGIIPDIELEYVRPDEQASVAPRRVMREEDLMGHMPPEEDGAAEEEPQDHTQEAVQDDAQDGKDDRFKMLLDKDNQVRHAVELLRTWTVFSRIKPTS